MARIIKQILIEQTYPGESDFIEHYRYVRRLFR